MSKHLYEIIGSSGSLSTEDIVIRMAVSVLFGIVIFFSYRITHTGSVYSQKFNISLLTLTILTTMVMTVIGNNIALSLGMVGALSIIRFRTSIKDSRDTVYIFWTIIIGICCGVGDFTVAAIGSSAVFLVLLFFGRVRDENRILLIVRADRTQSEPIRKILFAYFVHAPEAKVQNTTPEKIELIYELNRNMMNEAKKRELKEAAKNQRQAQTLLDKIYALDGIDYANIVAQKDEIT